MHKKHNLSVQYSLHTKITFNINVVGKKQAGKSSLVIRQIKDTFGNVPKVSQGFEFYSKTVHKKGEDVSVQIWDTAGKSQYNSMTRNFFRKAAAIILVYENVHNLEQEIQLLKDELDEFAQESVKLCIVRTKTDKNPVSEEQRRITSQICDNKFPTQIFYKGQVSAKTNENVHKYFSQLIDMLFKSYEEDEDFREIVTPSKDSFLLNSVQPNGRSPCKKTKKCC